jgi:hypothetical protein
MPFRVRTTVFPLFFGAYMPAEKQGVDEVLRAQHARERPQRLGAS